MTVRTRPRASFVCTHDCFSVRDAMPCALSDFMRDYMRTMIKCVYLDYAADDCAALLVTMPSSSYSCVTVRMLIMRMLTDPYISAILTALAFFFIILMFCSVCPVLRSPTVGEIFITIYWFLNLFPRIKILVLFVMGTFCLFLCICLNNSWHILGRAAICVMSANMHVCARTHMYIGV